MSLLRTIVKPVGRNVRDALLLCGLGPRLREDDRKVLEETIFPYLLEHDEYHRLLFVGCHWYTWHYNRIFAGKDYTTLEIKPARKRYGAKQHIIGSVEHVAAHFVPDSVDVAMLLGVIGWGLDDRETADRSIAGLHAVLRPGGLFILGCDDVPEHRPFPLSTLTALSRLEPWVFPPLGKHEHLCEGDLRHTFYFYRKR